MQRDSPDDLHSPLRCGPSSHPPVQAWNGGLTKITLDSFVDRCQSMTEAFCASCRFRLMTPRHHLLELGLIRGRTVQRAPPGSHVTVE
ncbi:unnamed protein product [Pieris macdunnoughi]|uniref:Uncharacterized protein n=1 Tax=Pieris macdunnoughi TaxID=345717 RepID=A0A821SD14_9NEOP|nr:unnamed protein product [Pieris macdunnoughi]